MNSYVSTPNLQANRTNASSGYVSSNRPASVPTGYVSSAPRRGAGSYVTSEWVKAA